MGLLGSALGRGLAGAGEASSNLAGKYIDEEMAANKARMLAELQHSSAVKLDQYNLSPGRQAQVRANATAATLDAGTAARQSDLAGMQDKPYQDAMKGKADTDAAAATQREIEKLQALTPEQVKAYNTKTAGTMDVEAQREALIADARERIKAQYDLRLQGAGGMKLPPGVKAEVDRMDDQEKQLNAAITKARAEGNWEPEKSPGQKQLLAEFRVLQTRRAQLIAPYLPGAAGGAADPMGRNGGTSGTGGTTSGPYTQEEATNAAILQDMAKTGVKNANVKLGAQPLQSIDDRGTKAAPLPAQSKPATPSTPGFWERATAAVGEALGSVGKEGARYNAIDARWREAGNGGPPLTDAEKAEARAFGLWVR